VLGGFVRYTENLIEGFPQPRIIRFHSPPSPRPLVTTQLDRRFDRQPVRES
jgi:hypothetical protein